MKLTTTGITETLKMLESVEGNTDEIFKDALEAGINVVTDEMRAQIQALSTSKENDIEKHYPKERDKKALLDSLGYTPVGLQGSKYNMKSGFDGYDNHKTKRYPLGHPNKVIAKSIERGTSFMTAQPFMSRASKKAKSKALEAMDETIQKELKKITK